MTRVTIRAAVLLAASLVLISGCTKWFARRSPAISRTALFAVTAEKTPFYRFGPQQGQGPDRELPRDTLVTLIRRSFGYAKVRLQDGEQGFVAADDLSRAPERLIAQVNDSSQDTGTLPPPPPVKLPTSDSSPEFEPTPIPQPLMPP
jgi:hypothetical protein